VSAFFAAAAASGNSTNVGKINPDTVDELNIPAYLGLWYQMAADAVVYNTFEKDSYCATALYGDNGDGTLSVHNYATIASPDGETYVIDGYAYQTKPDTEPGQLKVVFDSDDAAPFPAPYWILELGPINADGLYDYSIVSDSVSQFLFVLARDVDTFNSKYKADVDATLKELGFTGRSAPIDTYQGDDCVYESTTRKQQMTMLKKEDEQKLKRNQDLTTVTTLDVPSYMGYWYNMYGDKWVISTTLRNSVCNIANYVLLEDGTFTVHNSGNKKEPTGEIKSIDGDAYIRDTADPGKLGLNFDNVPKEGDYWILATGPVENGQYAYSIVSDPSGISLYVLARDPVVFADKYETEVLAMLEERGFTGALTTPVVTYQGADCAYEPLASSNKK